ncbi:MAG: DUF4157 domain-containing protein [Opitutae bacterium]|nr:DUF4157 domain-containing protein [Opitutae bacterium]
MIGTISPMQKQSPGSVALAVTRSAAERAPAQRATKPNRTGLPDGLKSGLERLSGLSLDHVRVHRNSARPAQLNAHAYAQGSDIHLAPGQEKHLPHEAWHIVQQAQGRVRPTRQLQANVPINDDPALEHEATAMGARALQRAAVGSGTGVVQRTVDEDIEEGDEALGEVRDYSAAVIERLGPYTHDVRELGESHDARYVTFAERMASGYKAWASNYYNKSQSYLYEAQKAAEHINVRGHNRGNTFPVLGRDTDTEPDLALHHETFPLADDGAAPEPEMHSTAVEMKASTSRNYASLDELVRGGIDQLKKREDTGHFASLLLEVHSDNTRNPWPITNAAFAADFGSDPAALTAEAVRVRLQARLTDWVADRHIALPITLRLELRDRGIVEVHVAPAAAAHAGHA